MFWDGLRSLLSFRATINKLNYFKFKNGFDCKNNMSTLFSVSLIARLPY